MGNTPREQALFMTGLTLGGGLVAFIITIFGSPSDIANRNLTSIILGLALLGAAFYWRSRLNKK